MINVLESPDGERASDTAGVKSPLGAKLRGAKSISDLFQRLLDVLQDQIEIKMVFFSQSLVPTTSLSVTLNCRQPDRTKTQDFYTHYSALMTCDVIMIADLSSMSCAACRPRSAGSQDDQRQLHGDQFGE